MVAAWTGVVIMPVAIVHGNLHLWWIAIVHAITAPIVVAALEILWVENIRIVVKAIAITTIP